MEQRVGPQQQLPTENVKQESNRVTRRKMKRKPHRPEFTKKFSQESAKSKADRKQVQFEAIKQRLILNGDWEDRKWYYGKHAIELREYIEEQRKLMELAVVEDDK